MSVYDRTYSAQIAPCSADWREAIHNGIDVVDDGRRWTESIAENAFLPTTKPVPVLLSHDEAKPVGEVIVRIAHKGWFHVDFKLNASKLHSCIAADRLKVGTPVSIGFRTLGHDKSLAEKGVMRHTLVRFDELSILRADEIPAYRGAKITSIYEPKPKPATRTTPKPAARATAAVPTGEVFYGAGPYGGGSAVITRRDHKAEAEDAELRRRLDWAERHCGRADFELILTNLKIELGYESDLMRHRMRGVAA
jgi:phage head maturation protease